MIDASQAVDLAARPPRAQRLAHSRLEGYLVQPTRRSWAIRAVYLARLELAGVRPDVTPHDCFVYGPERA